MELTSKRLKIYGPGPKRLEYNARKNIHDTFFFFYFFNENFPETIICNF